MPDEKPKEKEILEVIEKPTEDGGFVGVMQILVSKISRKAVIVAIAMILIYLLAAGVTTVPDKYVFTVCVIAGLAVFFTLLQWVLDKKKTKTHLKILERGQVPPPELKVEAPPPKKK